MRDYGVIPTDLWSRQEFRVCTSEAQLLLLYLLSGPHTNLIGCFRLPFGYVGADFAWTSETVSERFAELFEKGFASADETVGWVYVPEVLQRSPIANPNVGKAAAKLFAQVPDLSPLKSMLANDLRGHVPKFPEVELNHFETRSKPFRNGMPNQEQEQEQEQGQEPLPAKGTVQDKAQGSHRGSRPGRAR